MELLTCTRCEAEKPAAAGFFPPRDKKAMGVENGETTPAAKLAAAAKKPGKMGQRARLTQTLRKLDK